jgi:hypothetical protein
MDAHLTLEKQVFLPQTQDTCPHNFRYLPQGLFMPFHSDFVLLVVKPAISKVGKTPVL